MGKFQKIVFIFIAVASAVAAAANETNDIKKEEEKNGNGIPESVLSEIIYHERTTKIDTLTTKLIILKIKLLKLKHYVDDFNKNVQRRKLNQSLARKIAGSTGDR